MFAAVFVENFALQAVLRHTPELKGKPVALIPSKTPRARIIQCTRAAHASGVIAGMTPNQALARCGVLLVKIRSTDAETCARSALLDCAGAFSPWLEDTGEGVCTLELKELCPQTLEQFAESLIARLERVHLCAKIGFAHNPDLALLAAQKATRWRAINGTHELAELPLDELGLPHAMRSVLSTWGIHTLGMFAALGKEQLVERLGSEVLTFFERVTGSARRPLRCIPPGEKYEECIEFEHEIEALEPLLFMLRRLLEQITARLETSYLVAADILLRLGFAHGAKDYSRTFKVPAPTANVDVLFRTLHTHLERFTAEQPIVRLHLAVTPCRPARQQFGLFESALRDPNQFFETLARLIALLGNERVGVPELEDSHRPDAFRLRAVELSATTATQSKMPPGLCLRRFRPPLEAMVLISEGHPVFLSTPAIKSRVVAADGPMRLSGDWWDTRCWSRHEWDIELSDGTLCRIFKERGEWFLEGVYD